MPSARGPGGMGTGEYPDGAAPAYAVSVYSQADDVPVVIDPARGARAKTIAEVMVRLDPFPTDAGIRVRHPEMEHLWEFHRVSNGYRVPFGQAGGLLPQLDAGLRRFGGVRYRGVRDEGFTVGLF